MRLVQVAVPVPQTRSPDVLGSRRISRSASPVLACWCRWGSGCSRDCGEHVRDSRFAVRDSRFGDAPAESAAPSAPAVANPDERANQRPANPEPRQYQTHHRHPRSDSLPASRCRGLTRWVAEYYACGIGEAIAAAMPPRAWIESERHAQITDAGPSPALDGTRRPACSCSRRSTWRIPFGSIRSSEKAGSHATLLGLERDGLIEITQPLKGQRLSVSNREGGEPDAAGARSRRGIPEAG